MTAVGSSDGRFDGRVVIVTGSSSGIGEATARAFDTEGAHVVVNSSSSVEAGEKVAASLARGLYVQADVSDPDACAALVDAAVERFGRLDVLVNNAGITQVIPHHDLDAVTDELFRRILEVNVLGAFRLTRLALPHLRRGWRRQRRQRHLGGGRPAHGQLGPLRGVQGGAQPPHRAAGQRDRPGGPVNAVARPRPHAVDRGLGAGARQHVPAGPAGPLGRAGRHRQRHRRRRRLPPYLTGQVVVVDGGFSLR